MANVSPWAACWVLIGLVATAAQAVPRLGPPTLFMQQDRHRSAVVKVTEVLDQARMRVEIVEQLRGESPNGLVVRRAPTEGIEAGQIYILGHTDKPARRSHRWDTDPEGPRVLNVPAVGPALFENTGAMRALVREHPEDDPLTDRERLDAVMEQLRRPDVQSRRFVVVELALDPGLRELVEEPELDALRKVLESGGLEPLAHQYLLQAALPMVDSWGGEWLAADCRRELRRHGTELDLSSLVPSLLISVLETLEQTGNAADAPLAAAHVESNNPGVGKAAFSALAALDAGLAAEHAPGYLASSTLHHDTRDFVRRLSEQLVDDAGDR